MLDPRSLAEALAALFSSAPSAEASAAQMAAAYCNYAARGRFGESSVVITDRMRDRLRVRLLEAIATPGSPSRFASGWADALTEFWSGAAVEGPSGAGSTSGCTGVGILVEELRAVVAEARASHAAAGDAIARVLHRATLTVAAEFSATRGVHVSIA